MNAEPTNLNGGPPTGTISIGNITRALLITVPLLSLAAGGFGYTDLNIHRRMFVEKLGCGCADGFNTNDLTMTLGLTCMGLTLTSWWLAASGLGWRVRLGLSVVEAALLFFGFLVVFARHNWWL